MIIDFQHHYTPRELFPDDPGPRGAVQYDKDGVPSYSFHSLLYDLDEHIRMMDMASIDVAVLTSPHGMRADPPLFGRMRASTLRPCSSAWSIGYVFYGVVITAPVEQPSLPLSSAGHPLAFFFATLSSPTHT